jgi:hypothetical protein
MSGDKSPDGKAVTSHRTPNKKTAAPFTPSSENYMPFWSM